MQAEYDDLEEKQNAFRNLMEVSHSNFDAMV
jgi:hypothetical protein